MLKTNGSSHSEREKTDHSLKSERDKTNVVLENSTDSIEQKVDFDIQSSRKSADDARDLIRVNIDSSNGSIPISVADIQSEATVTKERLQSDKARKKERVEEDRLRQKERLQKSLIAEALLASERQLTDTDLLDERAIIDAETVEQAELLSAEQALHKISKDDLATRNRYLAIVSHDLKNPLGAIAMSANLICSSVGDGEIDPTEILRLGQMIERNAAAMERMISHLLDVERIAREQLKLNYEKHDVLKFLDDCKNLFSEASKSRGITLTCIGEEECVFITCDYDRILQVLSNLIGNALKFTPQGGTIRVTAKSKGESVEFSVKDTGPGIPDESMALIFEEFSQLKSTDRSGLGLGLYISKWLIKAHGGEIQVTSKIGVGSVFSFTLPKIPPDQNMKAE